jgi:hypothetical protein
MMGAIAVATLAFTVLFSSQTATAQMMMQNQMMQDNIPRQHEMNHNMFNVMGMSMVPDVRVTGLSITGNNTVSVNLTYTGNGTSPGLTIVAMTNHMATMNKMMMGHGRDHGGYYGGMTMGPGLMNNSGFPGMMMNPNMMMGPGMMGDMSSDMMMMMMMADMAGSHTGSAVVNSGWQPGNSTSITLDGEGSARDASDICVMVFPQLT